MDCLLPFGHAGDQGIVPPVRLFGPPDAQHHGKSHNRAPGQGHQSADIALAGVVQGTCSGACEGRHQQVHVADGEVDGVILLAEEAADDSGAHGWARRRTPGR